MVDNPVVSSTNPVPAAAVPIAPADLSAVFQPDQVVSGRVVQSLGSDQYVLAVRGRTLVASSQVPLTTDSVVKMQLIAGGDTPSLRMISEDATGEDQAELSSPQSRLQVLGLPASNLSSAALAAFEDAGAPLGRDALLAAIDALSTQTAALGQSQSAEQPALASALASLARSGLPATPATIALAMRAVNPALPNAAGALARAQGLTQSAVDQSGDTSSAPEAAPGVPDGVAVPVPVQIVRTGAGTAAQMVPPGQPEEDVAGGGSATVLAGGKDAAQVTASASLRSLLQLAIPDPGADDDSGSGQGAQGAMLALSMAGLSSSVANAQGADAAHAGATAGTAVNQTLVKHLAAALSAISTPAAPATATTASAPSAQSLNTALAQALVSAMHESSASTVFKPAELTDYDVVLAVPLQDQGQPTPTRLAVGHRTSAGGNTTFMRVDTELSHLGPVSVCLAGTDDSPLVITLLADGSSAQALSSLLPELSESLQKLGISAGIRVGELIEDGEHG